MGVLDDNQVSPHDLATNNEVLWFLEDRFTAITHPFKIDFVEHPVLKSSKIGMSMCPGRNKKNWRRDLEADLSVIVAKKVQCIVSLVRQEEFDSMGIPHFHTRCHDLGIETIHFPIVDKWIPSSMDELVDTVRKTVVRVNEGKIILVHCNGGKGRTGLIVSAVLVTLGMEPHDAVQVCRDARSGMIKNPAQLLYLRRFKQVWFKN